MASRAAQKSQASQYLSDLAATQPGRTWKMPAWPGARIALRSWGVLPERGNQVKEEDDRPVCVSWNVLALSDSQAMRQFFGREFVGDSLRNVSTDHGAAHSRLGSA